MAVWGEKRGRRGEEAAVRCWRWGWHASGRAGLRPDGGDSRRPGGGERSDGAGASAPGLPGRRASTCRGRFDGQLCLAKVWRDHPLHSPTSIRPGPQGQRSTGIHAGSHRLVDAGSIGSEQALDTGRKAKSGRGGAVEHQSSCPSAAGGLLLQIEDNRAGSDAARGLAAKQLRAAGSFSSWLARDPPAGRAWNEADSRSRSRLTHSCGKCAGFCDHPGIDTRPWLCRSWVSCASDLSSQAAIAARCHGPATTSTAHSASARLSSGKAGRPAFLAQPYRCGSQAIPELIQPLQPEDAIPPPPWLGRPSGQGLAGAVQ